MANIHLDFDDVLLGMGRDNYFRHDLEKFGPDSTKTYEDWKPAEAWTAIMEINDHKRAEILSEAEREDADACRDHEFSIVSTQIYEASASTSADLTETIFRICFWTGLLIWPLLLGAFWAYRDLKSRRLAADVAWPNQLRDKRDKLEDKRSEIWSDYEKNLINLPMTLPKSGMQLKNIQVV
jgi:hypothetical protein